jgi:hypothetical protein
MNDYARRRIMNDRNDYYSGYGDRRPEYHEARDMYDGTEHYREDRRRGRDMYDGHGREIELTKHDMRE